MFWLKSFNQRKKSNCNFLNHSNLKFNNKKKKKREKYFSRVTSLYNIIFQTLQCTFTIFQKTLNLNRYTAYLNFPFYVLYNMMFRVLFFLMAYVLFTFWFFIAFKHLKHFLTYIEKYMQMDRAFLFQKFSFFFFVLISFSFGVKYKMLTFYI